MREYEGGAFEGKSARPMCEAGWFDYACDVSELKERLDRLYPKVREVAQSKKINTDTMCVLFANGRPRKGEPYDEFIICDIGTSNTIYEVVPKSGHKCDKGRAELWGRENKFKGTLVTGTWENIEAYFGIGGAV
jgi:hypothetical protein